MTPKSGQMQFVMLNFCQPPSAIVSRRAHYVSNMSREISSACLEKSPSLHMNSMKLVIPLHSLYWSIHTKDESKRGTAFAFFFGVN